MHAKDDEIQDLKLQLHNLHRQSRRFSRANAASDTATPVPPVDSRPTAAPALPSNTMEIRPTLPSDAGPGAGGGARPAPWRLPMPPAPTEESRIIDRELRHGRLTDHVKSSANRGDLESFIAATCVVEPRACPGLVF